VAIGEGVGVGVGVGVGEMVGEGVGVGLTTAIRRGEITHPAITRSRARTARMIHVNFRPAWESTLKWMPAPGGLLPSIIDSPPGQGVGRIFSPSKNRKC